MFGKPILLFVDEGPGWLVEARASLQGRYEVVAVETGPEALALLESRQVSVLLTDSHLASVQDRRFSQSLQQHHAALPRIVLSARPELELAIATRNGDRVDAALPVPCDPYDLQIQVERITGEATVPRASLRVRPLNPLLDRHERATQPEPPDDD